MCWFFHLPVDRPSADVNRKDWRTRLTQFEGVKSCEVVWSRVTRAMIDEQRLPHQLQQSTGPTWAALTYQTLFAVLMWSRTLQEKENSKSLGNRKQLLGVFCIMQRQDSVCLKKHIRASGSASPHRRFKVKFTAWRHCFPSPRTLLSFLLTVYFWCSLLLCCSSPNALQTLIKNNRASSGDDAKDFHVVHPTAPLWVLLSICTLSVVWDKMTQNTHNNQHINI